MLDLENNGREQTKLVGDARLMCLMIISEEIGFRCYDWMTNISFQFQKGFPSRYSLIPQILKVQAFT